MKKEYTEFNRLLDLRKTKNKTIAEMSHDTDISASAISNYERGIRKPDADTLINLAGYFDCTTDYLLGLSDYKTNAEVEHTNNTIDIILKMASEISAENLQRCVDGLAAIVETANHDDPDLLEHTARLIEHIGVIAENWLTLSNAAYRKEHIPLADFMQFSKVVEVQKRIADAHITLIADNAVSRVASNLHDKMQAAEKTLLESLSDTYAISIFNSPDARKTIGQKHTVRHTPAEEE